VKGAHFFEVYLILQPPRRICHVSSSSAGSLKRPSRWDRCSWLPWLR